jgi:hypothetical protein
MADERVTIRLELDKKDLDSGLSEIPADAKRTGDKAGTNFTRGLKSGIQSVLKNVFSLKGALTGLAAVASSAFALREVVGAANEQEDSINRLNSAPKPNA